MTTTSGKGVSATAPKAKDAKPPTDLDYINFPLSQIRKVGQLQPRTRTALCRWKACSALKGLFPPKPKHYRGSKLKVAIIGVGLVGMSTAVELLDLGHEVDIYESR